MKFYSKEALRESRIFFDKNPPTAVMGCVICILFTIIVSLVISAILIKPYVVQAQGVVNDRDTQYISVNATGSILEVLVSEGEVVEANQEVMKIYNGQQHLQYEAIRSRLEAAEKKIAIMDKYQKSLDDQVNHMKNSEFEQEYFGYVEYYLFQVKSEQQMKVSLNMSVEEKEHRAKEVENEILKLNIERANFSENHDDIRKIDFQISEKQSELEIIQNEINSINQQINSPEVQYHQMYAQLMMELGKSRTILQNEISELENNLMMQQEQSEQFIVKSHHRGIIHFLTPLKVGMSIQQNQTIAEVSNHEREQYIVEAYVDAKDITKIQLGDKANIAIYGLNLSKYGTISGQLIHIDSGTVSKEVINGNILLYRVEIMLFETELKHTQETIFLMKSMPVEVRIVYENETYLQWMLGILNFKS